MDCVRSIFMQEATRYLKEREGLYRCGRSQAADLNHVCSFSLNSLPGLSSARPTARAYLTLKTAGSMLTPTWSAICWERML